MTNARYEVRLAAPVPTHLLGELGVTAQVQLPARTVLSASATDQAALVDLLDRISALWLKAIQVRRLPSCG